MAKVLIFDSGVGGLSIFNELQNALSDEQQLPCIYVMDNAIFPYGIRSTEQLMPRISQICQQLVEQHRPDILIVACNTASTFALPTLRAELNIPVVGVVPAIKTAAEKSQSLHIGLLATPATVNRDYTDQLISQHAQHCQIHRFGSSGLVELAERYFLNPQDIQNELSTLLAEYFERHGDLDYVVLGCTHFPLLAKPLMALWPNIKWVDSGAAIARRVLFLLESEQKLAQLKTTSQQPHLLYTTAEAGSAQDVERLNMAINRLANFASAKPLRLELA